MSTFEVVNFVSFMKKYLVALFLAIATLSLYAQNVNLMSMARSELDRRGLTEAEVRVRLLSNGIDIDHIPPSEYAAYQDRIVSILDQMQAEKAKPATAAEAGAVAAEEASGIEIGDESTSPQTTLEEALAETEVAVKRASGDGSPEGEGIYGHSLFIGKSLEVFRTTDGAQAPDTYVLGEGDEVHISIFGPSQTDIHQRIAPDGSIQPAGVSKIFLKGMTLGQARDVIRNRLAGYYSFSPDQIAVTITTARTLTVSIYGEVATQGGFTISALNTAFNALAVAGGPTPIGSLRNIQRSRGGRTDRLDLYKYMTHPETGIKYDLQNNDVLFVPVATKIVQIAGAVNRPMRYEMLEKETLVDLIQMAGGLRVDAYPNFVQIERYEAGEKKYLEFDLKSVMSGAQKIAMQAGDIVRIRPSTQPLENYVVVSGDVYYGGNYDLEKNHSLKTLLENAKPRYTARTEYVFVERTRPDETVEVLTVPFPGVNGNPDFLLQARDVVRVLVQSAYRDVANIAVRGFVRDPFSRPFSLNDKMTIGQAIELAGGLRPSVYPVAYIFRTDIANPGKVDYIPVNLETDKEKFLLPGDTLNVYDNSTFTHMGELRVGGAVARPVEVTFDSSLSVRDLLVMAGGFDLGAAYDRVEVFRMDISKTDEPRYDMITLTVDDDYNLVGSPDFRLQPYDHIIVRMTPSFGMQRTVQITGRVRFPGQYVLEDSSTQLSELIAMAGGLMDDADPYARLFRSFNGRGNIGLNLAEIKSRKGDLRADPLLMDGDVINIVRQENTVTIRETGTRMSQYVSPGDVSTQKSVVYQGGHDAGWYIRHYAGGFTKTADRNSVTVTHPNNQTEGTSHFLFFRVYPKVQPGSVIALRTDPEKEKKLLEPKEKINWDNVYGRVLTTITSMTTIVILVERLRNK